MYLHIGGEISIPSGEIIFILNIKCSGNSCLNREFIQLAGGERKLVETVPGARIKSCIITDRLVYLSPISSFTLTRRQQLSSIRKSFAISAGNHSR